MKGGGQYCCCTLYVLPAKVSRHVSKGGKYPVGPGGTGGGIRGCIKGGLKNGCFFSDLLLSDLEDLGGFGVLFGEEGVAIVVLLLQVGVAEVE